MIAHEREDDGFLRLLGERVRAARTQRRLTRRALAAASGVSERYLAQLEAGQGNCSVLVLRQLARALGVSLVSLVTDDAASGRDARRRERIALIGLRGAGKSTLGARAAERLGVPFVELDREIEREAGLSLATIFDMYGQAGYRRFERAALEHLLETQERFVVATGGSIVAEQATFDLLLGECYTVWLSADPNEHMNRVVAQGDMRPLAGRREAMADLRRILSSREKLYACADVEVSTSGKDANRALRALLDALGSLSQPAAERLPHGDRQ